MYNLRLTDPRIHLTTIWPPSVTIHIGSVEGGKGKTKGPIPEAEPTEKGKRGQKSCDWRSQVNRRAFDLVFHGAHYCNYVVHGMGE